MVNDRASVRVSVCFSVRVIAGAKTRASVRVRVTVSFRVSAVAESSASIIVRLWLVPGLGQG